MALQVDGATHPNSDVGLSQETVSQPLAPGLSGFQRPRIDDRKPEPPWRHCVMVGLFVFVEGDLHARNPRHATHLGHERRGWMAIARPMRSEQHNAVAVTA